MAVATSTIIAGAALAATAVSGYQQYQAASDAADAREEGQAISGAQQQIQQRRSTRQSIRENRIRRARIMQSAENTGVSGSSSQFGSTAALGTLAGANVAASRGAARASQGISSANQAQANAATKGQMWGAIGQIGSTAFQGSGGFDSLGLFDDDGGGTPIQGGFMNATFTGR